MWQINVSSIVGPPYAITKALKCPGTSRMSELGNASSDLTDVLKS